MSVGQKKLSRISKFLYKRCPLWMLERGPLTVTRSNFRDRTHWFRIFDDAIFWSHARGGITESQERCVCTGVLQYSAGCDRARIQYSCIILYGTNSCRRSPNQLYCRYATMGSWIYRSVENHLVYHRISLPRCLGED